MTLTFTRDGARYLASLLRIANDEDARVTQNVTVQRAEQAALDLIGNKIPQRFTRTGGCKGTTECQRRSR